MQRIRCQERAGWRHKAASVGFVYHTFDGAPYWDESAYYGFSLEEIEQGIEGPSATLDGLCRDLVARVVDDERLLRRLAIPERYWTYIAASWKRGDKSLYGRLDLRYDGQGPAKLLEYNADTPTALFEAAVFQWLWLEDAIAAQIVPADADQFNSIHERLIEAWRSLAIAGPVHLAGCLDNAEDAGTLAYLDDTARQAGLSTVTLAMEEIGRSDAGRFVDAQNQPITTAFKLYPWEWMFRETFGAFLPGAGTTWLEPAWKAILSSKGMLALLWDMFRGHPNLLPAYFDDDPAAAALGTTYVRKPLYSREGANVDIVVDGSIVDHDDGPYGAEGFVRQGLAPLPQFDGRYAVIGSWIVAGRPCGIGLREDDSAITKNTSRFLPHAIIG
jgi:glutathionylspermidine synthase